MDFDWDAHNINHIRSRHHLQPRECEEAMADPHAYPMPASAPYEAILGLTETARVLWVLFTFRGSRYRVATARHADRYEQELYWRAR
jgi:uncharacterized DUF497 family protein